VTPSRVGTSWSRRRPRYGSMRRARAVAVGPGAHPCPLLEEQGQRRVAGEDVEVPVTRRALAPDGVLRVEKDVPRVLHHRLVELLVDLFPRGSIERLAALRDQLV